MIKDKGVYTTKCPKCTRLIVMHVLSDGSISPDMCSECDLGFGGLDKGEERNVFVIVPKTNKSKVAVNEEVGETKKTFGTFSLTKKASKKSFGW